MPKTIGNLWIKVPEPPGGPFALHPLSILTVRPHPRKRVNKDPELSLTGTREWYTNWTPHPRPAMGDFVPCLSAFAFPFYKLSF